MTGAPICPADPSHGEMVEMFSTGIYYCYDCRCGQWLRESRRLLERAKTGQKSKSDYRPVSVIHAFWREVLDIEPGSILLDPVYIEV